MPRVDEIEGEAVGAEVVGESASERPGRAGGGGVDDFSPRARFWGIHGRVGGEKDAETAAGLPEEEDGGGGEEGDESESRRGKGRSKGCFGHFGRPSSVELGGDLSPPRDGVFPKEVCEEATSSKNEQVNGKKDCSGWRSTY